MPAINFKSQLYTIGSWTIARLPKAASAQLPSRGQVMVKGIIAGFPFEAALEPDGNGSHWLSVDKPLQKSARVAAGDVVALAIEPTKAWPEPSVPTDWQQVLDTDPQIRTRWQRVTPLARWEWLRWINATGRSETRSRRITVARSKLMAGERRPCCFNRNACCAVL